MSEPPSDYDRLILFCELVDEYDEIADAFPVEQGSFTVGGPPRPPSDRWARAVRAMVLRKFAFGRDAVQVERVLNSLLACLGDPSDQHVVDELRHTFQGLALTMRVGEGGTDRTVPDIIRDYVYGSLLHGDYDKHQRLKSRADLTNEMSLWQFTGDFEYYVRHLRDAIRVGIRDGPVVRPSRQSPAE